MMPEQTLLSHIRRAKARDEHAYRALVTEFFPMVYGLALSAIGNRADAEDVAQDAFVAAWTHLDRLQQPKAFPGWLRAIARNLARTYLRSDEYRRRLRQRVASDPSTMTQQETTMDRMQRDDAHHDLMEALQRVSPAAREALVLFYLEQRSVAEAAAALGISENALKVRLHDGRRQLRAVYMRRADDQLRDMLAVPPKEENTSRIMAGLAAGPVMASAADAATQTGLGLSLAHYNAMWDHVAWGGLVVSKKSLVAIVALIIAGLGGVWLYSANTLSSPEYEAETTPQAGDHALATTEVNHAAPDESTSATSSDPQESDDAATDAIALAAAASVDDTPESVVTATEYARPEIGAIDDPADYAAVAGFVIDGHGKPIPHARVQAAIYPDLEDAFRPTAMFESVYSTRQTGRHYETKTGSDGAYRIENIAYEGRLRMSAEVDGYFCDPRDGTASVSVKAGDALTSVNIVMKEGVTFYGRVISPTNEPVTDAVVRLVRFRSKGGTSTGVLGSTTTNANGEFQWGFVREGMASWIVSSPSAGEASFEDIRIGEAEPVELRMQQPGTLTGTIRHASGTPAAGVEVRVLGYGSELRGNSAPIGSAMAALTDSAGAYRIDNLDPAQSYNAAVFSTDGTPLASPVPIPRIPSGAATRWDAVIQAPMIVSGHVYGTTTGKPQRDIRVTAMRDGAFVEGAEVIVSADGAYELTLLGDPGEFLILPTPWQMSPDLINPTLGVPLNLAPGDVHELDLTFPDTFSITVRVVDPTGAPMEGVMTAVGEDDNVWAPAGYTDAEGRFTWAGFRPGSSGQILLYEDRNEVAATEPIVGDPGVDYPEQVITLAGQGGIEAIALDASGEPIANGLIIVEIAQPNAGNIQHQAPTDSNGHFVLGAGVPAANIALTLTAYNETNTGINRHTADPIQTTVPPNQIIDLGAIPFQLQETNLQIDDTDDEDIETP